MLKKCVISSLQLVLLAVALFGGPAAGYAAPKEVLVCGEAPIGQGLVQAKSQATEQMKQLAVDKALAGFVGADQTAMGAVRARYQNYVLAVTCVREQQFADHLSLVARVLVDFDALEADVKKLVKSENDRPQHHDDRIAFFVRVLGMDVDAFKVLQRYHETFSSLGFKMDTVDEEVAAMQTYSSQSYLEYVKSMQADIEERPEITVAVIGEIDVAPARTDAAGCTADGVVHITALNFMDHQVIAEFSDRYQLRRSNEAEACSFVLEKAAWNSAKSLAADTLRYWQNMKYN